MAVTAQSIVNRARRVLKDPDGTNFTDSELLEYLNEAVRVAIRQVTLIWPEYYLRSSLTQTSTQNITADTANYDLPSGLWFIVQVEVTDSDADTTEFNGISLQRTLSDYADGYYLRNDDIYLYDTPDANVTNGLVIRYVAKPTDSTITSSSVPLGDDFEDPIKEYVVIRGFARQRNLGADLAGFYKMLLDQCVQMGMRINRSEEDHGMQVEWRSFV